MLFIAIAALVLSVAVMYAIGSAYAAPRDSFFRTKRGILLLFVLGASFVLLPPQLTGLDAAVGPMSAALTGGLGSTMTVTWPAGLGKGLYVALWVVTSVAGLLVGMRIWQLGTPDWRSGQTRAYDASPASRAACLLPMANTVTDALDTLARSGLGPKDIPHAAEAIRTAGRRFADSLPPADSELYRLVSGRVPAAIAASVTGLLLEGAGRRSPTA